MSEQRKVGAWRAVGRLGDYTVKQLLWPEVGLGLLLGLGGALVVVNTTHRSGRLDLVGDVLPLAGGLLAVVFAGLALVVSIPSQNYMRAMAETAGGTIRFLDPFLIAVGTQATLLLLALGYEAEAIHVSATVEHICFFIIGFLTVFGVLDIVALARALVRHGINRGIEAQAEAADSSTRVSQLNDRRQNQ